jgi:DnaJ-class molecular chaperone
MDKLIFKDYYYLLGVQTNASEDDIKSALEKLEGKRSQLLLYEIKMILLNKELRVLYDNEYKLYSEAVSKENYEIQNCDLRKFLEDTKSQEEISVNFVTNEIFEEEENSSKFKKSIIWAIIGILLLCLSKCVVNGIVSANSY